MAATTRVVDRQLMLRRREVSSGRGTRGNRISRRPSRMDSDRYGTYDRGMPVCQGCGEDNPVRARFCLACGAALAQAPPRGDERKVVSVLFCDLVGFTSRAEQLDVEDVRRVLRPYYARLRT